MSAVVSAARVSKRYSGTDALRDVTLEVAPGESMGLIGPNGAGKSTFCALLAGYTRPSAGEVRVLGELPFGSAALKRKLGVLPQGAELPDMPSGVFLTYCAQLSGVTEARIEAQRVLGEVGLLDQWNAYPRLLSYGMRKRVALAQALIGDPALLLLDEPTAGLDPVSASQVRDLLAARRARGLSLLISSHQLEDVEMLCDTAAILNRGTLVQHSPLSALLSRTSELHVELAHGGVPLDALFLVPGVTSATYESERSVCVHYHTRERPSEETVSAVLGALLQAGARVIGVTRGADLARRVATLTRP